MEHDPKVAFRNGEERALPLLGTSSISRIEKTSAIPLRQLGETMPHGFPEFRFSPSLRMHPLATRGVCFRAPRIPGGDKFLLELIGKELEVGKGGLAPGLAIVINDFVLDNAAKPTADR